MSPLGRTLSNWRTLVAACVLLLVSLYAAFVADWNAIAALAIGGGTPDVKEIHPHDMGIPQLLEEAPAQPQRARDALARLEEAQQYFRDQEERTDWSDYVPGEEKRMREQYMQALRDLTASREITARALKALGVGDNAAQALDDLLEALEVLNDSTANSLARSDALGVAESAIDRLGELGDLSVEVRGALTELGYEEPFDGVLEEYREYFDQVIEINGQVTLP